jgi:glycerophosphoryl diester phosphodiesterase
MSLRRNGARAKGATAHGTARRATTVIAHRGASYLAPESTRIAYRIARDLGADFLEADLQATADGAIVVHHDDDLRRTTNVAAVYPDRSRSRPGAFTLEELRHPRLDAGAWFNAAHPARASAAFVGQKILTLADLVGIARDEGPRSPGLYLELKVPGIEEAVVDVLRGLGLVGPDGRPEHPVFVQCFREESLAAIRRVAPALPRVLLTDGRAQEGPREKLTLEQILAGAERVEAVVVAPRASLLLPPGNRMVMKRRPAPGDEGTLLVHPWAINNPLLMRLLTRSGLDGLHTDRPEALLLALGRLRRAEVRRVLDEAGVEPQEPTLARRVAALGDWFRAFASA